MYCPRCGEESRDSDRFCNACGLDLTVYRKEREASEPRRVDPTSAHHEAAGQKSVDRTNVLDRYDVADPYNAAGRYDVVDRYDARDRYGAVPHIPSYLGWAIVVLIFCFWPTGIAAVVYASQVDNRLASGDVAGARRASRKARMWCWITFGIGIAFYVVVLVLLFMLVMVTPLIIY